LAHPIEFDIYDEGATSHTAASAAIGPVAAAPHAPAYTLRLGAAREPCAHAAVASPPPAIEGANLDEGLYIATQATPIGQKGGPRGVIVAVGPAAYVAALAASIGARTPMFTAPWKAPGFPVVACGATVTLSDEASGTAVAWPHVLGRYASPRAVFCAAHGQAPALRINGANVAFEAVLLAIACGAPFVALSYCTVVVPARLLEHFARLSRPSLAGTAPMLQCTSCVVGITKGAAGTNTMARVCAVRGAVVAPMAHPALAPIKGQPCAQAPSRSAPPPSALRGSTPLLGTLVGITTTIVA
jgi:hypothetical protein